MPESRVTWATFVPILVSLGLSVFDLGPMYARDRQTDVRQTDVRRASSLNALGPRGRGHNNRWTAMVQSTITCLLIATVPEDL